MNISSYSAGNVYLGVELLGHMVRKSFNYLRKGHRQDKKGLNHIGRV